MHAAQAAGPVGVARKRHTFRCSACPQVARRLVISRTKMPVVDPLVPSAAPEAPTTNLQTWQQAAGSVLPNAVEKLHSAQAAVEEAEAADWTPTVERLTKALKERAVAARASAWAKTVEKLRSRQIALKERAVTGASPSRTGSSTEGKPTLTVEGRVGRNSRGLISFPKSPKDPRG